VRGGRQGLPPSPDRPPLVGPDTGSRAHLPAGHTHPDRPAGAPLCAARRRRRRAHETPREYQRPTVPDVTRVQHQSSLPIGLGAAASLAGGPFRCRSGSRFVPSSREVTSRRRHNRGKAVSLQWRPDPCRAPPRGAGTGLRRGGPGLGGPAPYLSRVTTTRQRGRQTGHAAAGHVHLDAASVPGPVPGNAPRHSDRAGRVHILRLGSPRGPRPLRNSRRTGPVGTA
jgi:hypothetical protein